MGEQALHGAYDRQTAPQDFIRRFYRTDSASLERRPLTPEELSDVRTLSEPQFAAALEAAHRDRQLELELEDQEAERWDAEDGWGDGGIEKEPGVVWIGKDKYVPELANAIEAKFPGKVKAVERLFYDTNGKLVTDLDIELDDIIIQLKSGSAKGLTTQMVNTAKATGKIVISYTPDIKQSSAVLRGVRAKGFEIFTDMDELLEYLYNFRQIIKVELKCNG